MYRLRSHGFHTLSTNESAKLKIDIALLRTLACEASSGMRLIAASGSSASSAIVTMSASSYLHIQRSLLTKSMFQFIDTQEPNHPKAAPFSPATDPPFQSNTSTGTWPSSTSHFLHQDRESSILHTQTHEFKKFTGERSHCVRFICAQMRNRAIGYRICAARAPEVFMFRVKVRQLV